MQIAWITGADGFIGRHLAALLIDSGYSVCGLGFRQFQNAPDNLRWSDWEVGEVDHALLDALAVRAGLPDIIFHLAGGGSVGASIAEPWLDFRNTVLSAAAVTDWMRQNAPKARLVQVSSAAVYGAGHTGPIAEDTTLNPYSPYGAHKLVAETLCTSATVNFELDAIIVRPFSIIGAGLRKQLLWDCCQRLDNNPDSLHLGGTGNELRDWLGVDELVRIIVALGESEPGRQRIFNVGAGQAVTVRDIVKLLIEAWGRSDLPVRFSGLSRPGDPFSLIADTTRLNSLGIDVRPEIDTVIADYVNWYRGI
jgi:UDP-glucose 4-epimerase